MRQSTRLHAVVPSSLSATPARARTGQYACVLEHRRVVLRAFEPSDEAALLAGRDDEWRRWLGPGHEHPSPTACIVVDGEVVGWIDSDPDNPQLAEGGTNIGYSVFPAHRCKGYASEALRLLVHGLRTDGRLHSATMEVDPGNLASLRVAEKVGFEEVARTAASVRFRVVLR